MLPFWPRKEFAEACAKGDWSQYKSELIDLYEFKEELLIQLKKDSIKPSIFFNNEDSAVLEVDALIHDLELELENY